MLSTDASGGPEVGRPPLVDVLEEHLEELGVLSLQRRKLLFSPDISLRRLLQHENRMEAHRDGLRVGEAASVRLAESHLDDDDPWLACAARETWVDLGAPPLDAVLERIEASPDELLPTWIEAFRALSPAKVERFLDAALLASLPPKAQTAAVDALAWHKRAAAQDLSALVRSPNAGVRRSVARHAEDLWTIEELLNDEEASVRDVALWSLALVNPSKALPIARSWLASSPVRPFPLRVLGLFGVSEDGRQLESFLKEESVLIPTLHALADLGDPARARAALPYVMDGREEVAEAAGDALGRVAGGRPPSREPGPGEGGDFDLEAFWETQLQRLSPGVRHLRGATFPPDTFEAEPPLELLWRLAVAVPVEEARWLRRAVPDGFFSGAPCAEGLPGE